MPESQEIDFRQVAKTAGPYPLEAYAFVREGLNYTAHRVHSNAESLPDESRHVSGGQLCIGLRDFAIDRYGLLAPIVLQSWNIHRTDDFGRIVFTLIDAKQMSKNANDTIEDFRSVYDFDEAFSQSSLRERVGRG